MPMRVRVPVFSALFEARQNRKQFAILSFWLA
jgi:hypothetical protein